MKTHSLTILHYGKDYLSYALRSIYHSVDQCHVFYTPTPSHGRRTDTPPVETRTELMAAAYAYDPDDKIKWYDMLDVTHEGPQRDLALRTVSEAGAELVVVVDCDEVWGTNVLDELLYQLYNDGKARDNLINMTHFWRSFNWAINDNNWPVRIIDLRQDNSNVFYVPQEFDVYHFGYAITSEVMSYKWKIHGHKDELRSNWFSDIWMQWPPHNRELRELAVKNGWDISVHPTNSENFWIPKPFDKKQLPRFMTEHPFFGLDKID